MLLRVYSDDWSVGCRDHLHCIAYPGMCVMEEEDSDIGKFGGGKGRDVIIVVTMARIEMHPSLTCSLSLTIFHTSLVISSVLSPFPSSFCKPHHSFSCHCSCLCAAAHYCRVQLGSSMFGMSCSPSVTQHVWRGGVGALESFHFDGWLDGLDGLVHASALCGGHLLASFAGLRISLGEGVWIDLLSSPPVRCMHA